jgi:hypothetical protein
MTPWLVGGVGFAVGVVVGAFTIIWWIAGGAPDTTWQGDHGRGGVLEPKRRGGLPGSFPLRTAPADHIERRS